MSHTARTPITPDFTNGIDLLNYDITSSFQKEIASPLEEVLDKVTLTKF
jgi:hypothetical protein